MQEVLETRNNISSNDTEILVDGANICGNGSDWVTNVYLLRDALVKKGIPEEKIYFYFDANFRHNINNKTKYEELIDRKIIRQTAAGTKVDVKESADLFIINYCLVKENARFITNDLMRAHKHLFPSKDWLPKRRITAQKLNDVFVIIPMNDQDLTPIAEITPITEITSIKGVGSVKLKKLSDAGITTIEQLSKFNPQELSSKIDRFSIGEAQNLIKNAKLYLNKDKKTEEKPNETSAFEKVVKEKKEIKYSLNLSTSGDKSDKKKKK